MREHWFADRFIDLAIEFSTIIIIIIAHSTVMPDQCEMASCLVNDFTSSNRQVGF